MRLRRIKDAKEKLEEFKDIVCLNPQDNKGKWQEFFPVSQPIYLEIGMGKGQFIIENAKRYPKINFIGCELSDSIVLKAARKIRNLDLKNLMLININANRLDDVFAPNEISHLFLNFSDPWPKTRHEKRRLTFDSYLEIYLRILKKPAVIEFKTDNRKLFEYSLMKFDEFQFKITELSLNLHEDNDDVITTEYEDKFKSLGQTIYFVKVEK
ncbi:MAG: tRNA (guanosine(46)-N7)-methyltransferase TrmB [Acholeplasmataceae bacterium]|nr:tRNA (guanosine(46)-N7)-methyltransferase TrmB [Acholeplasmataceae bacterium]